MRKRSTSYVLRNFTQDEKMVYAQIDWLAPDFGEITYEWCISLFGVVHLKLNKVNDNHKQTIWKINYYDEFNPLPRYIPSTPQFICLLLTLVLTEGAHVAKKNEVTKKWNAVNDHFSIRMKLKHWKRSCTRRMTKGKLMHYISSNNITFDRLLEMLCFWC